MQGCDVHEQQFVENDEPKSLLAGVCNTIGEAVDDCSHLSYFSGTRVVPFFLFAKLSINDNERKFYHWHGILC